MQSMWTMLRPAGYAVWNTSFERAWSMDSGWNGIREIRAIGTIHCSWFSLWWSLWWYCALFSCLIGQDVTIAASIALAMAMRCHYCCDSVLLWQHCLAIGRQSVAYHTTQPWSALEQLCIWCMSRRFTISVTLQSAISVLVMLLFRYWHVSGDKMMDDIMIEWLPTDDGRMLIAPQWCLLWTSMCSCMNLSRHLMEVTSVEYAELLHDLDSCKQIWCNCRQTMVGWLLLPQWCITWYPYCASSWTCRGTGTVVNGDYHLMLIVLCCGMNGNDGNVG